MTAGDEGTDVRKPGRPRDERADRAIVAATLDLLVESGFHALSVEAVAARAGVGKTTIYRRWPGKRELVADSLADLNADLPPPPPPGPARERLLALMHHICQKDPHTLSARIMPRMLSYRTSHPELFAEYLDRVINPRRDRVRQVVRDGIDRGELRADLDVELAALTLTSPLLMYAMSAPPDHPPTAEHAQRVLDMVWPGIAATA